LVFELSTIYISFTILKEAGDFLVILKEFSQRIGKARKGTDTQVQINRYLTMPTVY
jgi:hypothetical protein